MIGGTSQVFALPCATLSLNRSLAARGFSTLLRKRTCSPVPRFWQARSDFSEGPLRPGC